VDCPTENCVNPELVSLMITDVVMPEMSGSNLANQIHCLCPKIKTLFMSGYTANVIAHNGVLDEGVNFIQKPFSQDLCIKVRKVWMKSR
jgi:two-component system, cell cycle sensor histidine kinase and response regulator CckA